MRGRHRTATSAAAAAEEAERLAAEAAQAAPPVVVTGANGFAGARICAALAGRGGPVRAVVRRAGTAPTLPGVEEWVGDFTDDRFAARLVTGAASVVTTVYPMGDVDVATQRTISVDGTRTVALAAVEAGVERLVHLSTTSVYDRSPDVGDVDESAALVPDDAAVYAVTKRDTDAALAQVGGLTRVLLRPPAILGSGATSTWNTVWPSQVRDVEQAQHAVPGKTFAWVHVDDFAGFAADVALARVPDAAEPGAGVVAGACTPVNVVAGSATVGRYYETVTRALGVEPVWDDEPAWTGRLLAHRAHAWGWSPTVDLPDALAELEAGLRR